MKDFAKSIKVGNADISAISKHWSKATIDHILQNAHVFKKEVVEEAKRLKEAEKNKTGNSKVGNASGAYNKLETEIRYAISEATVASKILSGNFSATNIISALSHCKQCCDNAIKLAQEYDHEINK